MLERDCVVGMSITGALTPAGEVFVDGLRTAADALLAEPLPKPGGAGSPDHHGP